MVSLLTVSPHFQPRPQVFLEETSLVARPAVGFQELKDRLEVRLKKLGIKVSGRIALV